MEDEKPSNPLSVIDVRFVSFKQYELRILSERTTCTMIFTRDERHKDFPRENHKGENPTTSSEIE